MGCAIEYRVFAEQQLSAAEETSLPLVRMRHLEAAERWARLAEELERFQGTDGVLFDQDIFY
jgi:hypothetical protein